MGNIETDMADTSDSDLTGNLKKLSLSVVVPIYNEVDNVRPLVEDIVRELDKLGCTWEVILVNDGSSDGSDQALDEAAADHPQVKVIHFAANCGQTIAIRAGLEAAAGPRIVLMDGDRQNDPSDIGPLLERLEEGFACVSGWRKDRQDAGIRRWPSQIANGLVQRVTGVPVHDLGCTLKAYQADAIDPAELFGEMHRFLAVLAHARGGKIDEMVVKHHPRRAGVGKYGLDRTARVIADLFLIRILLKYPSRPSHLFANISQAMAVGGIALLAAGLGIGWWAGAPLLSVAGFVSSAILVVGAVCVLAAGLCAELIMRNRYSATGQRPYRVARTVNLGPPAVRQRVGSGAAGADSSG